MVEQGGEHRCQQSQHGHDQDHCYGGDGHLVVAEPPPGELPLAAALDRLFRRSLDRLGLELDPGDAHGRSLRPARARFSPASTGKWQAVTWVAGSPGLLSSGGSCWLQSSAAFGHRGWNLQPPGGLIGDGTSPVRMIRWRAAASFGSAAAAADSSAAV